MNSSISNSEPERTWRRFFRLTLASALALAGIVYAFVILVDPWDVLPLSPALARVPVSTNARFSFPALAANQRFDSAVFGTSTSRLLRPESLNPIFGGSFANLAMNSATAYEQSRLLEVFARNRPQARTVIVGLDSVWCGTGKTYEKYTPRPFPEWMYQANLWPAYGEMFNLYAVQEAGQQFGVLTGLKKPRYGSDGYTNFLPDDAAYDLDRARSHLARGVAASAVPALQVDRKSLKFPTHALLDEALARLPASTRKLLVFMPYHLGNQPPPGTAEAARWDECKARIATLAAATPNALVVDFMIPSPITREDSHYWDPLHYRIGIADRLMAGLAEAAAGRPSATGDYRILSPLM